MNNVSVMNEYMGLVNIVYDALFWGLNFVKLLVIDIFLYFRTGLTQQ